MASQFNDAVAYIQNRKNVSASSNSEAVASVVRGSSNYAGQTHSNGPITIRRLSFEVDQLLDTRPNAGTVHWSADKKGEIVAMVVTGSGMTKALHLERVLPIFVCAGLSKAKSMNYIRRLQRLLTCNCSERHMDAVCEAIEAVNTRMSVDVTTVQRYLKEERLKETEKKKKKNKKNKKKKKKCESSSEEETDSSDSSDDSDDDDARVIPKSRASRKGPAVRPPPPRRREEESRSQPSETGRGPVVHPMDADDDDDDERGRGVMTPARSRPRARSCDVLGSPSVPDVIPGSGNPAAKKTARRMSSDGAGGPPPMGHGTTRVS